MKIIYDNTKSLEVAPSNLKPIESNLKPLKKLVYLICMGPDKYVDMLNMCLYSLVKNGCFKGDIVVLSDFNTFDNRYGINLAGVNLRIVNVWNDLKTNIPLRNTCWQIKAMLKKFIDISIYESILYIDIDCLVFNSILPIFSQTSTYILLTQNNGKEKVSYQLGKFNVPHSITQSYLQTTCCAGVILISNKAYEVFDIWMKNNNLYTNEYLKINDQDCLALSIHEMGLKFINLNYVGFHRNERPYGGSIGHFMTKRYKIMCESFQRNIFKASL